MPLSPGDRIDRYEIVRLLGGGGMGEVYAARDPKLERQIAIKVLRHDLPLGTDGRAQLLREARAAATLSHPNVLAVHDVGEATEPEHLRGTAYIAMELVVGRSLRTLIGDATVPIATRVGWLEDIARALEAAHAAGVIHRDVKPENVMIRSDGIVKVLDFGIAKRSLVTPGSSGNPVPSTSGVVSGTLPYMAPEQLRGDPLDGRVDQFAWGVLAYELLTGALPWRSRSIDIVAEILSPLPAPACLQPDLSPAHRAIVDRALSKNADDRFPAMTELLRTLNAIDSAEAFAPTIELRRQARGPSPLRWRAPLLTAGILGLAVCGTIAASALRARRTMPTRERATAASAPDGGTSPIYSESLLAAVSGEVTVANVDHRGAEIAYVDKDGLWVAPVDRGARVRIALPPAITSMGAIAYLGFLPDGRLVLGWPEKSNLPLQIVSRDGKSATPARLAGKFQLAADGKSVAFQRDETLYIGPLLGGPAARVMRLTSSMTWTWSPDGRRFAIGNLEEPSEIQVVRSDGSAARIIAKGRDIHGYGPPYTAWRANDAVLYMTLDDDEQTLREQRVGEDEAPLGPPRTLWATHDRKARDLVGSAPDRVLLLTADSQADVYVTRLGPHYDKLESEPRRISMSAADDFPEDWIGADRVLVSSQRDGVWRVFAQPVDGGEPDVLLAPDAIRVGAAAALSDHSILGFVVDKDTRRLVRATPAGTVADVATFHVPESARSPLLCTHCTAGPHPRCVLVQSTDVETTLAPIDVSTGAVGSSFARISEGSHFDSCSLLADGDHVAVVTESELSIASIRDGTRRAVSISPAPEILQSAEALPDGQGFLVTGMTFASASYALLHVDAQGQAKPLRLSDTDWMYAPRLAPNGRDVELLWRSFRFKASMLEPGARAE